MKYRQLFSFARAAATSTTELGGLNNTHFFSHGSGGWKLEIKVMAELVSSAASLLGSWTVTVSLCLRVLSL